MFVTMPIVLDTRYPWIQSRDPRCTHTVNVSTDPDGLVLCHTCGAVKGNLN